MPESKKESRKKPSRKKKAFVKPSTKTRCKKESVERRKVSLTRDDGFYSWLGFVDRWRERQYSKGSDLSYKEALEEAREPWIRYKERNGLDVPKPKKEVDKDVLTWLEFVAAWQESYKKTFRQALGEAKKEWKKYKEDPENYEPPEVV